MRPSRRLQAALLLAALALAVCAEAAQQQRTLLTADRHKHHRSPYHTLRAHTHRHHSIGRKLLSALGLSATNTAEAAQIWPPRDPVGPVSPACYGPNCGSRNRWDNYGYTQAAPADGAGVGIAGGNNFYKPDRFMRPMPLAAPAAFGRRR